MNYKTVGKFLTDLKKEFGGEDDKRMKVTELKIKQGSKTIEKFVQEFKRTARGSRHKVRLLVEEFK